MRRAFGLIVAVLLIAGGPSTGAAHADGPEPMWADYYGRQIDLAESWEGAQACLISSSGNRCFDTEAELDEVLEAQGARPAGLLSTCSSQLRLYAGTSYATPVAVFDVRGVTTSVGAFANMTSSYKVGACSSILYKGGSSYPGNTAAGAQATSMLAGWDNTIDSVYIV